MTMDQDGCPPEALTEAVQRGSSDTQAGVDYLDELIALYPRDARLHFLRGSYLASLRNYFEGEQAVARAVQMAPHYAIARLQLGLLQLTSGKAETASATLLPLERLPTNDPHRLFASGLQHFMRDEWASAVEMLSKGIGQNTENEPLNNDMGKLLKAAQEQLSDGAPTEPSLVQSLIGGLSPGGTRH